MAESTPNPQLIHNALRCIPNATYVLTCCHDQFRDGIITKWVQQCSTDPPMLVVAISKGRPIEPMLRDARAFALCMVSPTDKGALRLFGNDHEPDDDPFLSLTVNTAVTGMPILSQSIVWFDCKLEGHLSPDADCRLYLGHVVAAHICDAKRLVHASGEIVKPPTPERRKTPRSQSTPVVKQFKQ
jgi:flavin reductase (DIM6/NTAB) family NADH-FMN oxidoreductase RutF